MKSIGDIIINDYLPKLAEGRKRHPVNNREAREPISSIKRAIIHQRDGGICRYCGRHSRELVLDHVRPRSAYFAHELVVADRSDNLQSACDPCNDERSNYITSQRARPGVTTQCYECRYPEDTDFDGHPGTHVSAYCGDCGATTTVPDVSWLL